MLEIHNNHFNHMYINQIKNRALSNCKDVKIDKNWFNNYIC